MKRLLILGDSYSTFEGYVPEGYNPYYHPVYGEGQPSSDVTRVDQTWWGILCSELGLELVRNDSWSGSTICHTGYNNTDCSKTNSFIFRLERLISEGFFENNEIDTVILFGGTNDAWARSPVGELKLSGHTEEDLYSVLPAVGYIIGRLTRVLPKARLLVVVNTGLGPVVTKGLTDASLHFGVQFVKLRDISKHGGHPGALGMAQIAEQVKAALLEN